MQVFNAIAATQLFRVDGGVRAKDLQLGEGCRALRGVNLRWDLRRSQGARRLQQAPIISSPEY